MKTLVALASILFGFKATAASEVLLNCKNLDQTDITSAIVQTYEDPAKRFSLELVLIAPNGEVNSLEIDSEDYNEGWISLPTDDTAERYLTRQADGWEIFGTVGQASYSAKAECEEKPLF